VALSAISSLPSERERTAPLAAGAETADSEAPGEEAPAAPAAAAGRRQHKKQNGAGPAGGAADDEGKVEEEGDEGFELVGVPDSELTPEQRKLKRRQQLLKAGRDARARARARKEQEDKDKVGLAFQGIA
jgi:hypothetical protein